MKQVYVGIDNVLRLQKSFHDASAAVARRPEYAIDGIVLLRSEEGCPCAIPKTVPMELNHIIDAGKGFSRPGGIETFPDDEFPLHGHSTAMDAGSGTARVGGIWPAITMVESKTFTIEGFSNLR